MFEINDDYDHKESLEYILENVLMTDDGSPEFKSLEDDYNSQLTLFCSCSAQKNSRICNDSAHCCHGVGYLFNTEEAELVLVKNTNKRLPALIECNDLCECKLSQCNNRLVQFGPRKKLEIFYSPLFKSMGLRTTVNIPCGAFICEYAGELLTLSEAKRRLKLIDKRGQMNYVLCLHEYARLEHNTDYQPSQITIVDPSQRGNIGRYLNHSCQPNCEILAVRINSPIPKIGIFAKQNISVNEELCFHYGGEEFENGSPDGKPCLCGAPNCTSVLPNTII
ncbi:probable histone-lysine N-methyltransferase set-23 [Drosophila innubila]|uniref:probable histone-lysine N-methyltransferase set-23 n=1 Tax=Drosophila innubila TaxID=198719 RepID=UPI00148DB137|nr:probable histone-lysine N-methyltransferase set-23 [Drosophila innubila]